jgi:hypothetical protein
LLPVVSVPTPLSCCSYAISADSRFSSLFPLLPHRPPLSDLLV